MKLLLALTLISSVVFADDCKPKPNLKFGTKVKIVSSTYSEWSDVNFVKGLTGHIVNIYTLKYNNSCAGGKVAEVSVCVSPQQNCHEFSLCKDDVEVIE